MTAGLLENKSVPFQYKQFLQRQNARHDPVRACKTGEAMRAGETRYGSHTMNMTPLFVPARNQPTQRTINPSDRRYAAEAQCGTC